MPEEQNALEIMRDPRVLNAANAMMIAYAAINGVKPGQSAQVDVQTVMDATLMIYASVLDMHPEVKTDADIEEAADDARAMIAMMIRVCRDFHREGGIHLFQTLGLGAKNDWVMKRPETAQ